MRSICSSISEKNEAAAEVVEVADAAAHAGEMVVEHVMEAVAVVSLELLGRLEREAEGPRHVGNRLVIQRQFHDVTPRSHHAPSS
jgi:hypothetical protein